MAFWKRYGNHLFSCYLSCFVVDRGTPPNSSVLFQSIPLSDYHKTLILDFVKKPKQHTCFLLVTIKSFVNSLILHISNSMIFL
jgi:hypothetical protein